MANITQLTAAESLALITLHYSYIGLSSSLIATVLETGGFDTDTTSLALASLKSKALITIKPYGINRQLCKLNLSANWEGIHKYLANQAKPGFGRYFLDQLKKSIEQANTYEYRRIKPATDQQSV
jgi:hypothetical protein